MQCDQLGSITPTACYWGTKLLEPFPQKVIHFKHLLRQGPHGLAPNLNILNFCHYVAKSFHPIWPTHFFHIPHPKCSLAIEWHSFGSSRIVGSHSASWKQASSWLALHPMRSIPCRPPWRWSFFQWWQWACRKPRRTSCACRYPHANPIHLPSSRS